MTPILKLICRSYDNPCYEINLLKPRATRGPTSPASPAARTSSAVFHAPTASTRHAHRRTARTPRGAAHTEARPGCPTAAHGESAVPDGYLGTSPASDTARTGARNGGLGPAGHQSARVPRHRHHPKPLQFHRRLDQTFQEHESPLRYPGSFTTPKYLMRLMFFNSQPSSACIHSCEEPPVMEPEVKLMMEPLPFQV